MSNLGHQRQVIVGSAHAPSLILSVNTEVVVCRQMAGSDLRVRVRARGGCWPGCNAVALLAHLSIR